nr:hypothetical protein LGRDSM20601_p0006 [Listeria grayi]
MEAVASANNREGLGILGYLNQNMLRVSEKF